MSRASFAVPSATFAVCLAVFAMPAEALSPPAAPDVAPRHIAIPAAYDPLVAQVQAALDRKGYDAGPSDGLMGSHTRSAIMAYQRSQGLLVTGQATPQLLNRLQSNSAAKPAVERHQERQQMRHDLRAEERQRQETRHVQRRLAQLGYRVDVTGEVDRRTREAIRAYQHRQGLEVTGEVSPALMRSLQDTLAANGRPAGERHARMETPYRIRISDTFEDGDYRHDPRWHVLQGRFRVEDGVLVSSVETPREQGPGRSFVEGMVNQTLGLDLGHNAAAIAVPTPFGNVFDIEAQIEGQPGREARMSFGPYMGNNAETGYRLVYDGASSSPLTLLAVTPNGVRTIGSAYHAPVLNDGSSHDVRWRREGDGMMRVTVDGQSVLDVRDRSLAGRFSGLSIVNGGGQWGLDRIDVASPVS